MTPNALNRGGIALSGAILVFFLAAIVHPFGRMKSASTSDPLLMGAQIDPQVRRIVERSCQNCHSEKTEWPWYSHVPPISWLIENDVRQGRSHMNLSRWETYGIEQRRNILGELSPLVRNRRMPLPKYVVLHPGAKLSDSEIEQLTRWARSERQRLKTATAPQKITPP
jgi:hypothetical protein